MPLYEYECQECGETSEVVRRFSDAPLTICSSCGGTLKKLVSSPAIQFKGSGFYLTDYGRSGSTKSGSSSESAKKTSSETPPAKSETKASD